MRSYYILFTILFLVKTYNHSLGQSDVKSVNVSIMPDRIEQQIVSISGNYCQATYTDNAWDETGDYTLRKFRPSHIRVPMPLKHWEPENDNDDPNSLMYSKYINKGVTRTLFNSLRDMKTLYNVSNFTISVWDVPDWMVENPEDKALRKIRKEMYLEAIESISAFMYVARTDYGIEFDYFSFNEATGGYQTYFTSEEIISFMRMAGPYFKALGFKTKFLVADAHSTISCVDYAIPILQAEDLKPYIGPLSYHSWWSNRIPDSEFERIDSLAKAHNVPVWCTELGFDAMAWTKKGTFETWDYGWKLAQITHRVLKHSRAEVTQYWTYQDNFPIVSNELEPYPSFHLTQQFTDLFPPGMHIVGAESDDKYVWVLAGKLGKEKFTVNLMNTSKESRKVKLTNIIPGEYNVFISTEEKQYTNIESLSLTDDKLDLTLIGNSMLTISNVK